MDDFKHYAYEKTIERIRKIVAIGAAVCGISMFLSANGFGTGWMVMLFWIGFLCFLVVAIALAFEYLIRFLFFRRKERCLGISFPFRAC